MYDKISSNCQEIKYNSLEIILEEKNMNNSELTTISSELLTKLAGGIILTNQDMGKLINIQIKEEFVFEESGGLHIILTFLPPN